MKLLSWLHVAVFAVLLANPAFGFASTGSGPTDAPPPYVYAYVLGDSDSGGHFFFNGGSYAGITGCVNSLPCGASDNITGVAGMASFNTSGTTGPFAWSSVTANDPSTTTVIQTQVVFYAEVLSSQNTTATLHITGSAFSSYSSNIVTGFDTAQISVGSSEGSYYIGGSCASPSCDAFGSSVPSGSVALDRDFAVPTNTLLTINMVTGINVFKAVGAYSALVSLDPTFNITMGTLAAIPDATLWISPDALSSTSPVPEPSTNALFLAAGVALALRRRRRLTAEHVAA